MTAALVGPQPLTELLVDELSQGRQMLVVIGRDESALQWRDQLGQRVADAYPMAASRVRRRSSGFVTVELIGKGYVDVVTVLAIAGGAARGRTYQLVVLPADADRQLHADVLPTIAATRGRAMFHQGLGPWR